jgi:hypothetical protein
MKRAYIKRKHPSPLKRMNPQPLPFAPFPPNTHMRLGATATAAWFPRGGGGAPEGFSRCHRSASSRRKASPSGTPSGASADNSSSSSAQPP